MEEGYPGTKSDDVTTGDGVIWGTGAMRDEDGAEGGMTGNSEKKKPKRGNVTGLSEEGF